MASPPSPARPWLLAFAAPAGESDPERLVAGAQHAATLDLLDRARESRAFERIALVTPVRDLAERAPRNVLLEGVEGGFSFGERLAALIRKHRLERPFYAGGGSGVFMSAQDWRDAAALLERSEQTLVTNNLYSADLLGFHPGSAIERVPLPDADNPLAQALRHAGLTPVELPRTLATQFDIDTPTDVLALAVHPHTPPGTRAFIEAQSLDTSRVERLLPLLTDQDAEIVVAGRVGSAAWSFLEARTACRVRLFSEERGMRADGRDQRGEARSLLAYHLEQVGARRFFQELARLGQAALIDTRVILAHFGLDLPPRDRFASDLGRPEEIADPFLCAFTEAALDASIPVLLGGHSLVSGGLMALTDAAWLRR